MVVDTGDADQGLPGARQLWAGRFQAVLSTQSLAEPGYPFGSLVPYCLDRAGRPILLLSHLAQHSRNLAADPRCALTLGAPTDGDLQQADRLTALGNCRPLRDSDGDVATRYLRYFPQGEMYFRELNFRFHRFEPRRFYFNGGFGTARWLGVERLLVPSPWSRSEEEEALQTLARHQGVPSRPLLPSDANNEPIPVGIDPWGLDLRQGERLTRRYFPARLADLDGVGALLGLA